MLGTDSFPRHVARDIFASKLEVIGSETERRLFPDWGVRPIFILYACVSNVEKRGPGGRLQEEV